MNSNPESLAVFTAAIIAVVFLLVRRAKAGPYSHLPLPPGPKRLPLLGNVFNMPSPPEWLAYHKWAKELNTDIIYLNVAGTDIVVLDKFEVALELLEKRSAIYSSRGQFTMLCDLLGWGSIIGILGYGEDWRRQRRMMHQTFHPTASALFQPYSLKACHNLLNRILDYPDDVVGNIRHMTAEIILLVTYGIDIMPKDDPYVKIAEHGEEGFSAAAVPGAFWVDSIPLLKYVPEWFPGAGFQRKAREWRDSADAMREKPFQASKNMMASGIPKHSFVSFSLDRIDAGDVEVEEAVKQAAFGMYGAGTDTTLASISSCILAFLEWPEVLKKAQEELDRVIKPGHLPDFEDMDSLPYTTAITMEALRWRDVLPLGLAHQLTVEDEYKGYRIPAGTLVIANSWAMLHNEDVYPNPFTFNPDRFMKHGKLNKNVRDPGHACWGFGRRICPGRYMAFSSIWITLASLASCFDIQKIVDEEGNVVEPNPEYQITLIYLPKPFKCSITPRSKAVERLIRASTNPELSDMTR